MLSSIIHILVLNPLKPKQSKILQTAFLNAIFWNKMFVFWLKVDWNMILGSNWQYISIGFDNDMMPDRQQAII